jgi:ADP-heptose:LPS heptosyltransferase
MRRDQQRLLVINFGGIGDEILFLPTLKTLKEELPQSHLTLLLEPRSRSVSELTDLIDAVITFDIKKRPLLVSDLLALLSLLRSGNYQTVISSGSSPLVSILLFLSGIGRRIGYDSGPLSRRLLTDVVRLNRNQYAADMYHDLVQGLGLTSKPVTPALLVREDSLKAMEKFLKDAEAKASSKEKARLVIHPGTSLLALRKGIIKTWPAHYWVTLIERLLAQPDYQVILAGGPDDAAIIGEITEKVSSRSPMPSFLSAFGATKSLADLASLIQLSDLLICVDSAPMHIAVGLGKPLVALFGPTDHGKLLPPDAKFKALVSAPEADAARKNGPGVQILPDLVYQAVLTQIQKATDLKRSQEVGL